mmetsp:Transcript_19131/g.28970  ORF Transcript_19131/g.28970 Transcript_19131/m.28970 type:complete len:282 (+) Transcript_19131:159-1004(+)
MCGKKKLVMENKELVFDKYKLRDKGGAALGYALSLNGCRVVTLSLKDCELCGPATRDRLRTFSKGIEKNTSVEWLDLSGNMIDDYSGQELANALTQNSSLRVLDISRNLLGWNGGGAAYKALSAVLPTSEITELKLGKNPTDGLPILIHGAINAPNLKALRLNLSHSGYHHHNTRSYCDSCQSIGYRGRQAAILLAKARPDLAVSYSDTKLGSVHLNTTAAYISTAAPSFLPPIPEHHDSQNIFFQQEEALPIATPAQHVVTVATRTHQEQQAAASTILVV